MAVCQYGLSQRLWNYGNVRVLLYFACKYTSKSGSRNIHQNETVDIYSEHALHEKSYKWSEVLFKTGFLTPKLGVPSITSSIGENKNLFENCTQEELITKLLECIRESDSNNLFIGLQVSKEKSYCLPSGFMMCLLKFFAKLGHLEGVQMMLDYFKNIYEAEFNKMHGFRYYTAQALWYAGHGEKSLEILEVFYKNNCLKNDANCVVNDIIFNALTSRGEASLVLITNFVQKLVDSYSYYYPMAALWKHLTSSDWFADQQLAKNILSNNSELVSVIAPLIPLWCVHCIRFHKIDAVHRLSEVLLMHKCLDRYSSVLHDLFDYYCKYLISYFIVGINKFFNLK